MELNLYEEVSMDEKTAMSIILKSRKSQEILFEILEKFVSKKRKQEALDTFEEKIYKAIFTSYHGITHSIQYEIFKEFPNVKKEFYELLKEEKNNG